MDSCRFGFPKPVLQSSFVDQSGRHHVKRNASSTNINPYNPYLLSVWKSAMDIQLCFDDKVDIYLAKYLTKQDTQVTLTLGGQSTTDHFKSRKIGLVRVVYDLLGYHTHRNSIAVIFIDTTLPGSTEQRRQLLTQSNFLDWLWFY